MPESKIDPSALHAKYIEERDKRLKNGDRGYVDPFGEFPDFDRDPWVTEKLKRDPISAEIDVAILGGGQSGLVSAVELGRVGVHDVRIIEEGGDFGGVWYWNRYPGVRCDIESYIYMPLLDEVDTVPKEKYATGKEIFEHCRTIGRHFKLYDKAIFQTKISEVKWNSSDSRWHVSTNRGDVLRARFVIAASGYQHRPKYPAIAGLKEFKGRLFHPSRWDFHFTGGSSDGELVGLRGKKVALIGTGATGIQILPHLAKYADRAYLLQRTPAAVGARNNRPTDLAWYKSLKPGWHQQRMDNFHQVIAGTPNVEDMVNDCWTLSAAELFKATTGGATGGDMTTIAEAMQLYDYKLMEGLRNRVAAIVKDPNTAEKLKAWYNLFCKRPLYSDDYLESFNNPSVTLVDTDGRGVERITETGLVANGVHYEVDGIIVATGFQVGAYEPKTATYPIVGRTGEALDKKWSRGIRSLHGLVTHGFPNFHIVGGIVQAGVSFNYTFLAKQHAIQAASIIARALREKQLSIEITAEAEKKWLDIIAAKAVPRGSFESECTPGYYNNEGDTSTPTLFSTTYGGGAFEYFDVLRQWRESGYMADTIIIKGVSA